MSILCLRILRLAIEYEHPMFTYVKVIVVKDEDPKFMFTYIKV